MFSSNSSDVTDEQALVTRLQKGEEAAFTILMRKYQKWLYGIAFGITADREESMEIVQEVFLKVFKNIHTFKGDSKLSSWLRAITVNQCLNWKRWCMRRFRWQHTPLDRDDAPDYPELAAKQLNPEEAYSQKELSDKVMQQLKKLPEKIRAVFILNVLDGLSYDEIADILKISRGTVSSRLFMARQKLKASLNDI